MKKILVSVVVTSYNHRLYIREAIEGVLRQKTDFPFELIIHDDCSTDGTQDIIREYERKYPGIVKPIYEVNNLYQTASWKVFFDKICLHIAGKYVALCEGDDYWTDEEKLQRQVDFMEDHPDFSLCMHNAWRLNQTTGTRELMNTFAGDKELIQRDSVQCGLGSNFPATASYFMKRETYTELPDEFLCNPVGDYCIRQYAAAHGKTFYFDRPMSVYRVNVPHSYMSNVSAKESAYNRYTIGMMKFYHFLDGYTQKRFHDILSVKIQSDFYGYCCSIDPQIGLTEAVSDGLDRQMAQRCFDLIDESNVPLGVEKFLGQGRPLLVYGTSRLANRCYQQMKYHQIDIQGFVVSDGQAKMDLFHEYPVYGLSQAKKDYPDAVYILAVQPINLEVIVHNLEKQNIREYVCPYPLLQTKG